MQLVELTPLPDCVIQAGFPSLFYEQYPFVDTLAKGGVSHGEQFFAEAKQMLSLDATNAWNIVSDSIREHFPSFINNAGKTREQQKERGHR